MLHNPKLIFGTHTLTSGHISSALKAGYKILDTATGYGNATEIRKAIDETGIIPTILTKYNPGDFKKDFAQVVLQHHLDLGREPDIILLHSPMGNDDLNVEAFDTLNDVYPNKIIGVSNFDIERLEHLIRLNRKPKIISLEFSPFYQPTKLVKFCIDNNILITGYRPTYKGEIFKSLELEAIAKTYNVDVSNLVLKWISLKGVIPIVSSKSEANIISNLKYVNLDLDNSNMLDGLNTDKATCMTKYCNHD